MCHLSHFLSWTQHAEEDEEDGAFGNYRFVRVTMYGRILSVFSQVLVDTLYPHLRLYRAFCLFS